MTYSIGGMTVDLNFKYKYGEKKCRRYLSDGIPLFSISATDEEIEKEKASLPFSTLETAEFDCVFRKLYNASPRFERILMHGATIMKDGKGFLFTAPSGTGKTTHIRMWGKKYGNEVTVIDGDKPFVGFENGVAKAWGSPRSGKEGWNNPISAPICGIAFLERNDVNTIERVSPEKIVDKAFMQFYIPKCKETAELTVGIINRLLTSVPLYILKCNMEVEAAEVAFNVMN
jgi:hypothetical protein